MEDNAVIKTNRKDTKKTLIRVLQIMDTTDRETPMNSKGDQPFVGAEVWHTRMGRKSIFDNMTTLME